jgi:hypothetical protein
MMVFYGGLMPHKFTPRLHHRINISYVGPLGVALGRRADEFDTVAAP